MKNEWIKLFNNTILTYTIGKSGDWNVKHYMHYSLDGELMKSCLDDTVLFKNFMQMTSFLEESFPRWKKLKIKDGEVYIKEKGFFKRWRKLK